MTTPISIFSNSQGIRKKYKFDNGYGASVIQLVFGSYISNENEWELAVLYKDEIVYDTSITDDVIGYLTDKQVEEILKKISELPEKKKS